MVHVQQLGDVLCGGQDEGNEGFSRLPSGTILCRIWDYGHFFEHGEGGW